MSGLNFHAVLEPNYHLVLAVDRHPFDKDMVGHRVEGCGKRLLLHERFQKIINGSQPGLLVGDGFFQFCAAGLPMLLMLKLVMASERPCAALAPKDESASCGKALVMAVSIAAATASISLVKS